MRADINEYLNLIFLLIRLSLCRSRDNGKRAGGFTANPRDRARAYNTGFNFIRYQTPLLSLSPVHFSLNFASSTHQDRERAYLRRITRDVLHTSIAHCRFIPCDVFTAGRK